MRFWTTINALARHVVGGFFIWGVLPVVFWLTGLTHKDSGGWGYKGASYPPDSSFIGFLRYFMEVAAPPACSTSPSAAVASWSATTYLPKPYSQLTYISIGCSTIPRKDCLGSGGRVNKRDRLTVKLTEMLKNLPGALFPPLCSPSPVPLVTRVLVLICFVLCVCVYVCVRERERERVPCFTLYKFDRTSLELGITSVSWRQNWEWLAWPDCFALL